MTFLNRPSMSGWIQRSQGGWRNGGDGPQDVPPSDEGRSGELGPPPPVFREGLGGGFGDEEPPPYTAAEGQPSGGGRTWPRIVVAGVALLILLILLNIGIDIYVDRLWFGSVGYQGVFDLRIVTQLWLFAAGAAISLAVLGGSYLLAWRMPIEEMAPAIDDPRLVRVIHIIAAVAMILLAIIFGSVAAGQWELILQFLNAKPFGETDPQFGRDLGFYIFELEALQFMKGWATGLAIMTMLTTAATYGTRLMMHRGNARSTLAVRLHIAITIAAVMGLFVWSYWLARFELALNPGGFVFGATYTDDNIRSPVQIVKMVAGVLVILGVLSWPFHERLRFPITSIVLLILVSIVGAAILPAAVQRFTVEPNELQRETPYIERNIAATRTAFALDRIEEREFPAGDFVGEEDRQQNPEALRNVRLWDHRPLNDTLNTIQTIRPLYVFPDVDVDRYNVGGEERQVFLAARELSQANLQSTQQGWVNRRLQFTHGFGVVMTPVDEVSPAGEPDFWVSNIPPEIVDETSSGPIDLRIEEPRIYYGEVTDAYIIANSETEEFDYPLSGEESDGVADQATTRYSGDGGIELGGFFRRLAFAWSFGDANILISGSVDGDSRILFRRLIQDRVNELAPFLRLDADPYIVVGDDGKLYWIQDAYTVTDRYPYSQPHSFGYNYVRNSVKAVIDAYNGSVDLYIVDPADPIIQVWSDIFPELFKPAEEFPVDLQDHWRYPQDYFQIQADQYLTYHIESARGLFNREDLWAIPQELLRQQEIAVEPYYVTLRLPDQEEPEFLLILPFTPRNRLNSIAWMAGRSDGENYGKLFAFRFPANKNVDGPKQIENRIDQDVAVSQQFTLLGQQGSEVIRGNLLFIPVGDSYVYVEPIYLQAETGRYPQLKGVIVVNGDTIAFEDTFVGAVEVALGNRAARGLSFLGDTPAQVATDEPDPTPAAQEQPQQEQSEPSQPLELSDDAAELAEQAQEAFEEALQKQREGDWAGYGLAIERLGAILERLAAAESE
ncbi:MAG: UPF0182 family protein [Chloroflexi bacterium]|nr:UPF0182 family protein [Chloroflexota bacterium]MYJ02555.1 UPF0182 family protein [Chloroflexota bacterium]